MNSVAVSLFVFGIYCIVNGLGFAFAPNFFLGMLGQRLQNRTFGSPDPY